jgi:hypothetical protein
MALHRALSSSTLRSARAFSSTAHLTLCLKVLNLQPQLRQLHVAVTVTLRVHIEDVPNPVEEGLGPP